MGRVAVQWKQWLLRIADCFQFGTGDAVGRRRSVLVFVLCQGMLGIGGGSFVLSFCVSLCVCSRALRRLAAPFAGSRLVGSFSAGLCAGAFLLLLGLFYALLRSAFSLKAFPGILCSLL